MRERASRAASLSIALSLVLIAGCISSVTQMTTGSADQDFEQLWDYFQPAESEVRLRAALRTATTDEARLQLLTQIARTHSLRHQFAEAHRLLDEVERSLPSASDKVKVRYDLERGRTFNSAGDKTRAKELFLSAWQRASAAGLQFYAIDAAHMMAFVTPPAEQHEWNLKALALVERTGDPRAQKWQIPLYNNIGWTYHDQGDYPAAMTMFQKALSTAEARGKPEQLRIAKWTVARCLRSLGRYDEALTRQIALRDENGPGMSTDGYVYEEIGENLLALQRNAEAKPSFARAYVLLRDDKFAQANEVARLERMRTLGGVE